MMKLIDKNESFISTLKGTSAIHDETLNGPNNLEIKTVQHVEKGQRILFKDNLGFWQEFIVKGVEETREKNLIYYVYAESSISELWGDFIEDKRAYDSTANIALEKALAETRWQVGIVDNLGIASVNFYRTSVKEAVQSIVEEWNCELRTRITISGNKITGRYIDLLQNRGEFRGKRFTYTKDLLEVEKIVHRDDVITALYGYGKGEEIISEEGDPTGGFGRRIDFAEINDGKAYVENNSARLVWGRNNPDGTKSHVFDHVIFDDIEDKAKLKAETQKKLDELSEPLISYRIKVVDLKSFGVEFEGVGLGDSVIVKDKEFIPELNLKAKILRIKRDLYYPQNTEITLGNYVSNIANKLKEQNDIINSFRDKQGIWDRTNILDKDGINAQYLKNLVDELNTRLNSQGGWVYQEPGKGITTYDKPLDQNPTMALQLLGGAFRIANSKKPNGDWDWRTFGDGDGFAADALITGLLRGGKIKFDLTNGTFIIGDSIEDYDLYFDGQNLRINLGGHDVEGSLSSLVQKLENFVVDAANRLYQSQTNIPFLIDDGELNIIRSEYNPFYRAISNESISMYANFPKSQYAEDLKGQEVTIGLDVRLSDDGIVSIDDKEFNIIADTWTRVYITKIFEEVTTKGIRVINRYSRKPYRLIDYGDNLITISTDKNQLDYRNMQVQKGDVATNWTLTPEELEASIIRYESEIKQLADEISLRVTAGELESIITILSDEISSKVSQGQLSTEVIQNAESWGLSINGKLEGQTYNFNGQNFTIGGTSGDTVEHDNQKSVYHHSDGSRTEISALGLYRYEGGSGKEYHHLIRIIKFSAGADGQAPTIRWIPIGEEFNDTDFNVALSISDSIQATSNEATLHRIVLTQGVDSNNTPQEPRFRNGQWEYPVTGYTTYYNHTTNSRRYSDVAGIMIVIA